VSFAINGNNVPYVAYNDVGNWWRATVMKYSWTNWEAVWTLGFSPGQTVHTSFAINSNNIPYMAFADNSNWNKLTVMKFNWTNWEIVWTSGFSLDQVYSLSLSIDNNNIPYISYVDYGSWQRTTVKKFNWTSWETVGTPGFSSGIVGYTSLAIDNNNNPYIVYDDQANWYKATVMKFYTPPEGISTYKWYRDNTEIVWATTKTYSILSSDQAKTIKFQVTPVSSLWAIGTAVQSTWLVINTESSGWWWGWGGWWGWGVANTGIVNTGSNNTGTNNTGNIQLLTWNMSGFSQEFIDAYLFAYKIWITTQKTIQKADLNWYLTRAHMAKMMSNYAIKIMSGVINTWRQCNFKDIVNQSVEMKSYIKLSCQLGIMWVGMENFNPNWLVSRAEFGTVLSRILYGNKYNNWTPYYIEHLKALKKDWIIRNIDPSLKEVRWYVMLMLMRATKIFQWE
jgi:hypothetical protein